MTRRLVGVALPGALLVAIFFVPAVLRLLGFKGEHQKLLHFGLPVLALVLLVVIFVLLARMHAWRWLWPAGAGILVQAYGVLFLLLDRRTPPTPEYATFIWTTCAILLAAIGVLLYGGFVALRSSSLERHLVEGTAVSGGDPHELEAIRRNMLEALTILRKAGRGRNAIYELPWYLVIGRPAAGKTVAIKNSGLGLPVRKDWVKGEGGTRTCDWFFTNEMIFMDTPGRWVMEGADEQGRKYWSQLLKLLLKFRGRRPLDGLVVVVPADDLLGLTEEEIEDQAAKIREIIDVLHQELQLQFPIYLLVSKSDLVEGFVEFFHGLPPQQRHEMLGWSNDDPNEVDVGGILSEGFQRVVRRLEGYRLEMIARTASRQRTRRLFFFPEELKRLERPLRTFAEVLFYDDSYRQTPVFRGFYFCSGTQGEGSTFSNAMRDLRAALGLNEEARDVPLAEQQPKRSYFLLDLFRELMLSDRGLVNRTALHWLKQRRDTLLVAFLPAVAAVVILLFMFVSWAFNRHEYLAVRDDAPRWARAVLDAEKQGDDLSVDRVQALLAAANEIKRQHEASSKSWNPFKKWGMRWHGDISRSLRNLWMTAFEDRLLRPLLRDATDCGLGNEGCDCATQADVLRGLVSLRLATRWTAADTSGTSEGLDALWISSASEHEKDARERIRADLPTAFVAYRDTMETDDFARFLDDFDGRILAIARALETGCVVEDQSILDRYAAFEQEAACDAGRTASSVSTTSSINCFRILRDAVDRRPRDYAETKARRMALESARDTLGALERREQSETFREAGLEIEKVHLRLDDTPERQAFDERIAPGLRELILGEAEFVEECRQEVSRLSGVERDSKINELIGTRKNKTREDVQHLQDEMGTLKAEHEESNLVKALTPKKLARIVDDYRYHGCIGATLAPPPVVEPPRSHGGHVTPSSHPHRHRAMAGRHAGCHVHGPDGDAHDVDAELCAEQPKPTPDGASARPAASPRVEPPAAALRFFETARPPAGYTVQAYEERKEKWKEQLGLQDLPSAQLAEIRKKVENEARTYARNFGPAWEQYLSSIRLRPPTEDRLAWLRALGETMEWETAVKPAADASAVSDSGLPAELAFLETESKVVELRALTPFLARDLGDYKELLVAVAADLEDCGKSADGCEAYVSAARSGKDKSNNLYQLQRFADRRAGKLLVSGALTGLFASLVENLPVVIKTKDPREEVVLAWRALATAFDRDAADRFPFDSAATSAIQEDAVSRIFGPVNGLIAKFEDSAEECELPVEIGRWVRDATERTAPLFMKDTDKVKSVRLNVGRAEGSISKDDLAVGDIIIRFGSGSTFRSPAPAVVMLEFFATDRDVVTTSEVRFKLASLLGKPRPLKEVFGDDGFRTALTKEFPVQSVVGQPWSEIALLQRGSSAFQCSGRQVLSYSTTIGQDGNEGKKPSVTIELEVDLTPLEPYCRLREGSLERPPRLSLEQVQCGESLRSQ